MYFLRILIQGVETNADPDPPELNFLAVLKQRKISKTIFCKTFLKITYFWKRPYKKLVFFTFD